MKRLLILSAGLVLSASFAPPVASAETIACAAQVPSPVKGRWYYRVIDGRKCWYEGKPMMPKTSLYWPKATVAKAGAPEPAAEADAPTRATDGRAITAAPPAASAPHTPTSAAWPTPAADDGSFESRWLGLQPRS